MFIYLIKGNQNSVFSLTGPDEEQIVPMFENGDDAERYVVDQSNYEIHSLCWMS